ncbi:MAG TPA: DUF6551 family protein [Nocardioides sp.]|uniref:DUF6551 family protein n=1 Tax=Nocardioides sp. TaxID=35761 RepID=UPI002ED7DA9F
MSEPTNNKPARQAHLAWVNADDLQVNPVAQREFKPTWGQWILDNFDIDKFQVPHVNQRNDGSLYVMEGQHSCWAYRHFFGEGQQIQVWLYKGLTEQQEAEFFLTFNNKKQVDAMAKFKAAVTAGRTDACDINRIVRANGCTIGVSKNENSISAIGALITIYQKHGAKVLARTIRTIRDAFTEGGFERPVLLGVAAVFARYADDVDDERLVQKLAGVKNGWKGLIQRMNVLKAQYGVTQPEAAAAAVVEFYNSGRGGVKLMTWWAA